MRVVTINIHQSVPGNKPLGDANEDERALRDVATYLRKLNPDVVLVQEVDDDRPRPGKLGVTDQFSKLRDLVGVTDAEYTPALLHGSGDAYGTAILTRNGYTIGQVHNLDLPNPVMPEDRGAGISQVLAPDGTAMTVVHTHLAHKLDHQSDRPVQLRTLAEQLRRLQRDGKLAYDDAITGERKVIKGLDTKRMLLAGDLNTVAEVSDQSFWQAGLRNVMFEPEIVADPVRRERAQEPSIGGPDGPRIDHVYVNEAFKVDDVWVDDVPRAELPAGFTPTDHRAVVSDVHLVSG